MKNKYNNKNNHSKHTLYYSWAGKLKTSNSAKQSWQTYRNTDGRNLQMGEQMEG